MKQVFPILLRPTNFAVLLQALEYKVLSFFSGLSPVAVEFELSMFFLSRIWSLLLPLCKTIFDLFYINLSLSSPSSLFYSLSCYLSFSLGFSSYLLVNYFCARTSSSRFMKGYILDFCSTSVF